jgi:hypothetical protein
MFGQQFYDSANADLFVVVENLEPASEFVGALTPSQALCHRQHNASRVILSAMGDPMRARRSEVTRGTVNVFTEDRQNLRRGRLTHRRAPRRAHEPLRDHVAADLSLAGEYPLRRA